ncbi:DUF4157 domain-containing protein [Streptomyces sp. NPDC014733]|uniref:eCIS core domain-containing protein n=1 Tax=Streptomyces sp. NPDC014733 TaxID=3364885 RepID=UPI0036FC33F7
MRAQDEAGRPDAAKSRRAPAPRPAAGPVTGAGAPSHPLLALQNSAGNAAVVQLLRQAGLAGSEEHRHGAGCGHEQGGGPQVQRSRVHEVLRTSGRPLDEVTRGDMEARLGADFSDVRVHDDGAAKASAAEVGARAYTSGSHVVLGAGGGDPHTLAHELTHVIQQRQGPVAGTDHGDGLRVSDPSDRFEREAEANATRVMRGPAPAAPVAAQRSVAAPAGPPAIQRRGENPHAKSADHQGWTTTAHHIVAHSTLTESLGRLGDAEQLDVLTTAIPKEISREMLANLKIGVPEEKNTPEYLRNLRKRLADKSVPNSAQEYGVPFGDIRHSFFEWQAGNQFIGPNTSIRAEPTEHGHDIDTDGRYLSPLGDKKFTSLTELGEKLKDPRIKDDETVKALKEMLHLTKNAQVADFDPRQWDEITDWQEVEKQAGDLGRAHLEKYTFFKFTVDELKTNGYLKPAKSGGGYEYYDTPVKGAATLGKYVYIPYTTQMVPPPKEGKAAGKRESLAEFCKARAATSTFLPKGLPRRR